MLQARYAKEDFCNETMLGVVFCLTIYFCRVVKKEILYNKYFLLNPHYYTHLKY